MGSSDTLGKFVSDKPGLSVSTHSSASTGMPGCGRGCKFGDIRIPLIVRTLILNWVPCPGLNGKKLLEVT